MIGSGDMDGFVTEKHLVMYVNGGALHMDVPLVFLKLW